MVRLDDSITEETMDIDLSTNQQDSESLLQRTIFDEIINSLEEFSNALVATLIEQLETGLKLKVSRYKEERYVYQGSSHFLLVLVLQAISTWWNHPVLFLIKFLQNTGCQKKGFRVSVCGKPYEKCHQFLVRLRHAMILISKV